MAKPATTVSMIFSGVISREDREQEVNIKEKARHKDSASHLNVDLIMTSFKTETEDNSLEKLYHVRLIT